MRSNVEQWQELQAQGYFENHPDYKGVKEAGGQESLNAIARFVELRPDMEVVVIGCGYGRETLKIAPEVRAVYGIDVSTVILDKAAAFLKSKGVDNFVPVTHADYKHAIPDGVDLVYSIVVMQHITRDLVIDYFRTLGSKLKPGGSFVVQFLQELFDGVENADAQLELLEPSISWTARQLAELSQATDLEFGQIHTLLVTPTALWHWTHFRKPL